MDDHRQRESLSFDKVARKKPRSRYLQWNLDNPLLVSGFVFLVLLCIVGIIGANIGSQAGVIVRADIGTIAEHDYKAPRDFTFDRVDREATEKNREQRMASVLPIYNWDTAYRDSVMARIRAAFATMRSGMDKEQARLSVSRMAKESGPALPQGDANRQKWADSLLLRYSDIGLLDGYISTRPIASAEIADGIDAWFLSQQHEFEQSLGFPVSDDMFSWLSSQQFAGIVEDGILQAIDVVLGRMIVASREEMENTDAIVVQWYEAGERRQRRIDSTEKSNILTLDSSENLVHTLLRERFSQAPESVFEYFRQYVRANVTYDETATQRERQNVSDKTPELRIVEEFKKGQTIVSRGNPIKQVHYEIFEKLAQGQTGKGDADTEDSHSHWVAIALLAVVLTFLCWRSIVATTARRQKNRDLIYMSSNVLMFTLFLRLSTLLGSVLDSVYHWPYSVLLFFPFASIPMVTRIVVNRYYAYLISVSGAILTGLVVEDNLVQIYAIMSMMAGCLLTDRPKRSNMLLRQGVLVGLVSGVTAFAMYMLRGANMNGMDYAVVTLLGIGSGLLSTGVVMIGLPVAESVFGYVTSNKLLELSNLEHPALKTLFLEAPGTYQHSIMVGSLNEAAAEAIGANAILARVGGYYHDIGKVKNAQYFAENQRGDNPHNRLKPNMSALILKAHEKDGLDIARKYKLPQDIMDFIATHHGTSRIEYFYQRAKEQQDRVHEEDYRYPGPRPQTRETGICMVSDMVEAAVRSLPDKSPDKIHVLVHKLINHKFTDGQFDECDLTLRDLNDIANALLGILNAFYHHRPEYPDQKKERERQEAEKREAEKKAQQEAEKREADKKAQQEAEKREADKKAQQEADKREADRKEAAKSAESAKKPGDADGQGKKNDRADKKQDGAKAPEKAAPEKAAQKGRSGSMPKVERGDDEPHEAENAADDAAARETEEANELLKEEPAEPAEVVAKTPLPNQDTYELTFSSKVDVFKKS